MPKSRHTPTHVRLSPAPKRKARAFMAMLASIAVLILGISTWSAARQEASPDAGSPPTAGAGADIPAAVPPTLPKGGPEPAPEIAAALSALADLEVRAQDTGKKYDRGAFGQRWSDDVPVEFGHNGCDTRNDILARDLDAVEFKPRTRNCVVLSGDLADPYTGELIHFQRGEKSSQKVQIDHVVALKNAWVTGAARWDDKKRQQFANDPTNLLAVDGPANMAKGSQDAASWLPSNNAYRCTYVSKQVGIKKDYGLWVTPPERDAMQAILTHCPR